MVRINLISPKYLMDQHLIAEYKEIQSLISYAKRNPDLRNVPEHMNWNFNHWIFFKNKLKYIEKRFRLIRKEMKNRGFKVNIKSLGKIPKKLYGDYKPGFMDYFIIITRLVYRVLQKPFWYRYKRKKILWA